MYWLWKIFLSNVSRLETFRMTFVLSQLLSKVTVTSCIFFRQMFKCVRLAAGRRTKPGGATDQWRDQQNAMLCFYKSSGRVATHLRCGGFFSDGVITNFLSLFWQ